MSYVTHFSEGEFREKSRCLVSLSENKLWRFTENTQGYTTVLGGDQNLVSTKAVWIRVQCLQSVQLASEHQTAIQSTKIHTSLYPRAQQ